MRTVFLLLVGVLAAMFLGAVGAALWVAAYVRNPPVGAALITGTIAMIVGLAGVFQEHIRLAWRGPSLACLFDSSRRGDVHISVDMFTKADKLIASIPSVYVRLRIANLDCRQAD
jgi:hypothetical protein